MPGLLYPKMSCKFCTKRRNYEPFIQAFAEVNGKAREKRDRRKQEIASEAVHNPVAAAQRKIMKHVREKERRKRSVDDRRSQRGGVKKRRHV